MAKGKIQMKKTRAAEFQERQAAAAEPTPREKDRDYKQATFWLPLTDLAWIDAEIERYRKATKVRLKKSHIVHIALELVRQRGGIDQAIVDTSKKNSSGPGSGMAT